MRLRRRKGLQFGKRRRRPNLTVFKEVMTWTIEVIIVVALAFTMVYFAGQRTKVIGNSMEPQFKEGDQLLINRFAYIFSQPKANDIIVFLPNGNEKAHHYVKRVVAGPGDTVQIIDGILYVNGCVFEEEIEVAKMEYAGIAETEITLGTDEYFVLGDNRNNSEDSRYANIGLVKGSYIIGKAWFIVQPFSDFGFIK